MSQPYFVCALNDESAIPEFSLMVEEAKAASMGVKVAHDMNELFLHVENPDCFGVIFVEGFAIDMISAIEQMKFATDAKCVLITKGKDNARMLSLKAHKAGAIAVIDPPIHRVSLLNRARQLRTERPKVAAKAAAEEEVKPQFRGLSFVFPKGDYRQTNPAWEKESLDFRRRAVNVKLNDFEQEFHKLLAFLKGQDSRIRLNLYSMCPRSLSEGFPSLHFRRLTGSDDAVRGPVAATATRVDLEAALVERKSIIIPNMDIFRKENKYPAELDDKVKSRASLLIANSEGKVFACLSAELQTSAKGADLELLENILCFFRGLTENLEEFDYLSRAYYGV